MERIISTRLRIASETEWVHVNLDVSSSRSDLIPSSSLFTAQGVYTRGSQPPEHCDPLIQLLTVW